MAEHLRDSYNAEDGRRWGRYPHTQKGARHARKAMLVEIFAISHCGAMAIKPESASQYPHFSGMSSTSLKMMAIQWEHIGDGPFCVEHIGDGPFCVDRSVEMP